MDTDDVFYEVYRSRNKGEFWSRLTHGMHLNRDEAEEYMELEHASHPSDWLRVVKVEHATVVEARGNSIESKRRSGED